MRSSEKLFLVFVAILMAIVCVFVGMKVLGPNEAGETPDTPTVQTPPEPEQPKPEVQKEFVNVFFIGQNANHQEVYKAVKRDYDKNIDGSKIKFAINALVMGPKNEEVAKGVYTEIPAGTRVLSISEQPDKVIINLNSTFEMGGGSDSLYKRTYQLIKTAKINSTKPVYLYLDNKKVDVIGGEGLMFTQPLNDKSLN